MNTPPEPRGISLALVASALGYKTHFVFSDAFSEEKRFAMLAYGATITDVPSDRKQITKDLIQVMIAKAEQISRQPGHWWADQLNNVDGADGYAGLGDEIWQQTAGQVDALVHTVSTAHSLHGMSRALRGYSPTMPVYAVEPLGVGNDMALAALDLLAGIIATQTGNVRGLC